jgi:hypothetical protein
MDKIRYDLRIANVSNEAVVIPWSAVVIHRRDRPEMGYRHAYFELLLKKDGYEEAVVDSFVLYGAPTVPGSLRALRPRETVVVRLPGILSGTGMRTLEIQCCTRPQTCDYAWRCRFLLPEIRFLSISIPRSPTMRFL